MDYLEMQARLFSAEKVKFAVSFLLVCRKYNFPDSSIPVNVDAQLN